MSSNPKLSSRNKQIFKGKNSFTTTYSYMKSPLSLGIPPTHTGNFSHQKVPKISASKIMMKNLRKYNITRTEYNVIVINDLIDSKSSHFVAVFKDYMIADYIDEFLRREYNRSESVERIPKFANYYKNYLTFFCKPIFCDFFFNTVIQSFGEAKAEIYYNNNYGKKKKKKKALVNEKLKTIFSSTIKDDIDRNSIITLNNNNEEDRTLILTGGQNSTFVNEKCSVDTTMISLVKGLNKEKPKPKEKSKKKEKPNQSRNINIPLTDRLVSKTLTFSKQNLMKANQLTVQTTRSPKCKGYETTQLQTNPSPFTSRSIGNGNKSSREGVKVNHKKSNSKTIATNSSKFRVSINPVNPIHIKTLSSKYSTQSKGKKTSGKISLSNRTKPSANLNLDNLMKLTLKLYQNKNMNNTHISNNSHHHSPTINNFNININNHICFNNNSNSNSNTSNPNSDSNANKGNRINLQNIIDFNKASRNKPMLQNHTEKSKTLNKNRNLNSNLQNFFLSFAGTEKQKGYELLSPRYVHNRRLSNNLDAKAQNFMPKKGASSDNKFKPNVKLNANAKLKFPLGRTERNYYKKKI